MEKQTRTLQVGTGIGAALITITQIATSAWKDGQSEIKIDNAAAACEARLDRIYDRLERTMEGKE